MTNTLHRYGNAESFRDDYVVFAMASKGKNDDGCVPKLKRFLEMALPFSPVNLGDAIHGGSVRPSDNMNPAAHWNRELKPDFRAVIDGVNEYTTAAAVFDNLASAEGFVKAVKEADLGLCINISTAIERGPTMRLRGRPEAPQHWLFFGLEGKTEKLPNSQVLTLSTMCGHGMISASFAKKMIDWVKEAAHPRASRPVYGELLLLRRLQSKPGQAHSGRGACTPRNEAAKNLDSAGRISRPKSGREILNRRNVFAINTTQGK